MRHSINLGKYKLRTDIALDIVEGSNIPGIKVDSRVDKKIKITDVDIDIEGSKVINKKPGFYVTIEFEDITDIDNYNDVLNIFKNELRRILDKMSIKKKDTCLVVGLGNDESTPDALGPLTINDIIVTNHLYLIGGLDNKYRRVSTFKPGVMGENGIETSDIVKSIIKTIKPDFIIVIDALSSGSIDRVNKTIQMTDAGIEPGSGIGNSRKELSKEVLKIPVLSIGVPTVVDAVTIVSDTINYMYKHYSYALSNKDNPANKLKIGEVNYLNKKDYSTKKNNHQLFGIIGDLSSGETKELIREVLTPIGYNLMVTPKEIDFIVKKLSSLIANGINNILHEDK